jgi:hypothetical protein
MSHSKYIVLPSLPQPPSHGGTRCNKVLGIARKGLFTGGLGIINIHILMREKALNVLLDAILDVLLEVLLDLLLD